MVLRLAERQNSHTPDKKTPTAKRNCERHPALCTVILLAIPVFKYSGQSETTVKRYCAQNTKRTINQAPANWYLTDRSTNQSQRNNEHARDDTGSYYPDVSHWVNEWPDEENGDDDMRKRQPIGAISQPRMPAVTVPKAIPDCENPVVKAVAGIRRRHLFEPTNSNYSPKLTLEWKSCNTAHNKTEDEKAKHGAEPTKNRDLVNCWIGRRGLYLRHFALSRIIASPLSGSPIVKIKPYGGFCPVTPTGIILPVCESK
jgi:hypothetical protein